MAPMYASGMARAIGTAELAPVPAPPALWILPDGRRRFELNVPKRNFGALPKHAPGPGR